MNGWGRTLVVALVGGGMAIFGASYPIIAATFLGAAVYFVEVDVFRLKREAEGLQDRLGVLEDEVGALRRAARSTGAPSVQPVSAPLHPEVPDAQPLSISAAAPAQSTDVSPNGSHWGFIVLAVIILLGLVWPQISAWVQGVP